MENEIGLVMSLAELRILTNGGVCALCVVFLVCGQQRAFTEDERDNLQSNKLTNVVRLRPNDLPDRSKDLFPAGPFGNLTNYSYRMPYLSLSLFTLTIVFKNIIN